MDNRIAKNFIYSASYQILMIIAPLITAPYISRVLQPAGVGTYSYTETYATAFALIAGLGFNTYGQREVAYCQDDIKARSRVFFEIFSVRTVTTLVTVVAYVVFSLLFHQYTVYLLPQVMVIVAVMFDVTWYFHGVENFRITVLRNVAVKILTIALTFLLVKSEKDLGIYIVIHSASVLLSNMFYMVIMPRYVVRVDRSELHPLRHMRGSIEFFIPLIAVNIYSYLDKLMLGWYMTSTVENGYYEQARKIATLIVAVIISLNNVMMSRVSNLYAKERKEDIIHYYVKTFNIILLLVFPICIGLLLVSDNFVVWFFGADFKKVAVLLKYCSLLIAFMCVGNFVGVQFLGPTGRQNKMTMAYIVAAVSNVALNALLIPRFYSVGAIIASVIAEFISCGLQVWLLMRSSYRFNMLKTAWIYILGSGAMVAAILALHWLHPMAGIVSTIVDVALGAVTYIAVLFVLREENTRSLAGKLIAKLHPTRKT